MQNERAPWGDANLTTINQPEERNRMTPARQPAAQPAPLAPQPRRAQPVCSAAPAPLCPVFLDAASARQRQPVQVFRLTVMVTYQLSGRLLPAMAGPGDRRAVHPPFCCSRPPGPAHRQVRQDADDPLREEPEIAIMALAAWGFAANHVPVLLLCTFLMGLHSTLFGLVKFACYMPQVLNERELTGGNGMVEMGTSRPFCWARWRAACSWPCLQIGAHRRGRGPSPWRWPGGWWRSSFCPPRPPTLVCHQLEPFTETWRNLMLAHGRTWWCSARCWASAGCGSCAVFLSQFPALAKDGAMATSKWPRCCWWCSRWAWAWVRCCARCCRAAMSKSASCRWARSA